ncbi:hypothetical protein GS416_06640 [Rhodococcus hoagii]|nr:hypothetical protein [Prescottella equi]
MNRTSSPFGTKLAPFPGWSSCSRPGCSRWTGRCRRRYSPTWPPCGKEQQDESAGWAVQLVNADGTARRLAGQDAAPVPDIDTTLDLRLQTRAEDALASVPQPAAIVALRAVQGRCWPSRRTRPPTPRARSR